MRRGVRLHLLQELPSRAAKRADKRVGARPVPEEPHVVRTEITLTEIAHLAETLEEFGLDDRERLVLRQVFELAVTAVEDRTADRTEIPEGLSSGLISLHSEPPAPEEGSLPSINEGFEAAFRRGAAASFDLSKSAPAAAGPEGLRITARLV
jgi:hypothetical protein